MRLQWQKLNIVDQYNKLSHIHGFIFLFFIHKKDIIKARLMGNKSIIEKDKALKFREISGRNSSVISERLVCENVELKKKLPHGILFGTPKSIPQDTI